MTVFQILTHRITVLYALLLKCALCTVGHMRLFAIAGRSLYERLEISGMRSQLLRRSADLKKNIGGSQKYLDVLREMSSGTMSIKQTLLLVPCM